jgi:hypothetical protein
VLAHQYPDAVAADAHGDPWHALLAATGRSPH